MSTEKIEAAVQKVTRSIQDLAKAFERFPQTEDAVQKSFNYLAMVANAAQQRAQASVVGPGVKFTLDMDLPKAPVRGRYDEYHVGSQTGLVSPVPAPVVTFPAGARAPTRSGLTVEQLGGRMVAEARGSLPGGATPDTGADFIDEDDDEGPASPTPADDDDITFVDD